MGLVVEQRATMTEIETTMTLDSADLLSRALAAWHDAEARAQKAASAK